MVHEEVVRSFLPAFLRPSTRLEYSVLLSTRQELPRGKHLWTPFYLIYSNEQLRVCGSYVCYQVRMRGFCPQWLHTSFWSTVTRNSSKRLLSRKGIANPRLTRSSMASEQFRTAKPIDLAITSNFNDWKLDSYDFS